MSIQKISGAKKGVLVLVLMVGAIILAVVGSQQANTSEVEANSVNANRSKPLTSAPTTHQIVEQPTTSPQTPTVTESEVTESPTLSSSSAPSRQPDDFKEQTNAPSTGSPTSLPTAGIVEEVGGDVTALTEVQLRYEGLDCSLPEHLDRVRAVLFAAVNEEDTAGLELSCGSVVAKLRFVNEASASLLASKPEELKVSVGAIEATPVVQALNSVRYVTVGGVPCVFGVVKGLDGTSRKIDGCLPFDAETPLGRTGQQMGETWCPTVAVFDMNDDSSASSWGVCKEEYRLLEGSPAAASTAKPHVLIIMVDDLGWKDIGYRSGQKFLTPTLDELAADGLKLERMYTTPLCGPSRAAFMTGRMQHHTGFGPATGWNRGYSVSGKETMLWEVFKANGYHNMMFGKFGIGGVCDDRYSPLSRGFDNFVGPGTLKYYGYMKTPLSTINGLLPLQGVNNREAFQWEYAPFKQDKKSWANEDLLLTKLRPLEEYKNMHLTDVFGIEASNAVAEYRKAGMTKPLLMYLSFRAPHTNFFKVPEAPKITASTPKQLRGSGNRAEYLRMVNAVDQNVKKVVDAYKREGLWNDTLLVFVSDNGGLATPKGGANNGVLNGGKGLLFEGGIRVPSFIRGTNSEAARVRKGSTEALMHITDIYPTLVEAAGLDGSKVWKCSTCNQLGKTNPLPLDGISQWSLMRPPTTTNMRTACPETLRQHIVHSVKPEHATFVINKGFVSFKIDHLLSQVAPAVYDPEFYRGNNYKNYINVNRADAQSGLNKIAKLMRRWGGSAVTGAFVHGGNLRYLKLMLAGGKRTAPYTAQTATDRGQVKKTGRAKSLPRQTTAKFPQFRNTQARLYDITKGRDVGEQKNLISNRMSKQLLSALDDLLYLYTNATANAVLDVYLRRGLTPDTHLLEPQPNRDGDLFWGMPMRTGDPYLCIYDDI